MKASHTLRGFDITKFRDRHGYECSLQKSSIATEDCVWLGVDFPYVKVLASDAVNLGIPTEELVGWIDYPIPNEVSINSRMHLTRQQVADLLPYLQKFVDTGELQ